MGGRETDVGMRVASGDPLGKGLRWAGGDFGDRVRDTDVGMRDPDVGMRELGVQVGTQVLGKGIQVARVGPWGQDKGAW